jgi:hypothetical protein
MTPKARIRLAAAAALTAAAVAYFRPVSPEAALDRRIDSAFARATRALRAAQSPDGAFRSNTYGLMKDGLTLTPHVMLVLQRGLQTSDTAAARSQAATFLLAALDRPGPVPFATYTLPAAISALSGEPYVDPARIARLVTRLRALQFNETHGWSEADPCFGGWGYDPDLLPKNAPLDRPADANLSATAYALRALRDARVPPTDPAVRAAVLFIHRCQNFPATAPPTPFDDGGFFFSPTETGRNKAGDLGPDPAGRQRFRSYGAMTADGLRSLAYANQSDSPESRAAAAWLAARFSADVQPGDFPDDRRLFQLGMYYYYLAALAQAAAESPATAPPQWKHSLAEALLSRQTPAGVWLNRYTDAREDDPLIATMHAALALSLCRSSR